MSFKRLVRSTQRILGELEAHRADATSTKERQATDEAIDDVRADLLNLADDLEERAEYLEDYWRGERTGMPWADHVARQEAIAQRKEVLALLEAAQAAPAQAVTRPARPATDPRATEIARLEAQLAQHEAQLRQAEAWRARLVNPQRDDGPVARLLSGYWWEIEKAEQIIARLTGKAPPEIAAAPPLPEVELV
jgi:hypothetical protein